MSRATTRSCRFRTKRSKHCRKRLTTDSATGSGSSTTLILTPCAGKRRLQRCSAENHWRIQSLMHEGLESALANRYRLDRELGRGGMATVYLAWDMRHDRKVA